MEAPDLSTHTSSSFPLDPADFDADDRISYSKLDNKFILVQEDGTEYEFDNAIRRWIPLVDEALLEEQQKAYAMEGVDETEPVEAQKKKRKKEHVNGEDVCLSSRAVPLLMFSCILLVLHTQTVTDKSVGEWENCKSPKEIETITCTSSKHRCLCYWPSP